MKTALLRRSVLAVSLVALSLGGLSLSAQAQDAKKNLVIGGTAGSNADQLKAGIIPILEKKGYKVKLVEFNDYVQPNLALAQGSLDANFFQHRVYLQKFSADQKLDLAELVQGPIAPMGVYSTKRKTLADVKEGDRVTLPNDPSNLARALVLLEQNKLVTIKAGIDPLRASEKDVAENPKKLKFIPLEAAQLPRSLVRMEELRQSTRILEQAIKRLPDGPVNVDDHRVILPPKSKATSDMESMIHHFKQVMEGPRPDAGECYVAVESPKGEKGYYMVSDGTSKPVRWRIRPPSFVNLSAIPRMVEGHLLSDVIAINASIDIVMGEIDR